MKVGLVTTWGTDCGIAAHSRMLHGALTGEGVEVVVIGSHDSISTSSAITQQDLRVWEKGSADAVVRAARSALTEGVDVFHVEHQYGWFEASDFARGTGLLRTAGVTVTTALHSLAVVEESRLRDDWLSALNATSGVIVHREADALRLRQLGLDAAIEMIPLGVPQFDDEPPSSVRASLGLDGGPVLATFGFILPHKGHMELLRAAALLKSEFPGVAVVAASALHANPTSLAYLSSCILESRRLGMANRAFFTARFLSEAASIALLHAADVIVLPYGDTAESASAAVNMALSARRPVMVTRQRIFDQLGDAVYRLDDSDPGTIADGVRMLLNSTELRDRCTSSASRYLDEHSWGSVAERHRCFWGDLVRG